MLIGTKKLGRNIKLCSIKLGKSLAMIEGLMRGARVVLLELIMLK
jgi:hypothetical protein